MRQDTPLTSHPKSRAALTTTTISIKRNSLIRMATNAAVMRKALPPPRSTRSQPSELRPSPRTSSMRKSSYGPSTH